MKKRVLALLLSVLMTLSLLPVSAFAADLEGDGWKKLDTVTEGEYTDTTAKSDTEYEYTVVGSDGSVQTVDVPAADDTGDVDTTYGTVGKTTGTGATYYELVTTGADGIESGKQYLIVSANSGTGYALTKTAGAAAVDITTTDTETKITVTEENATAIANAVFTLESNGNGGYYLNGSGTYLIVSYGSLSTSQNRRTAWTISDNNAVQISYSSYGYARYIVFSAASGTPTFAYNGQTNGRNLYLFAEKTEPAGTVYEITWSTAADALLNECENLTKDKYTDDSWNAFQTALKAAQDAKTAGTFGTEGEANTALATMPALKAAKDALVKVVFTEPKITWERTLEYDYNTSKKGELITEHPFTAAGDDDTYPTVFWTWDTVSKLTTDKTGTMVVWDYGTASQYAKWTANTNIKAATWANRADDGSYKEAWGVKASVRKFAGTFEWPAGYDLDDTASLMSVNDSYYQPIYNYVAQNADYAAVTKGKYVLPVNDDIYVFMYADGTELTEDNYMDYLVFWTGTSGKGVWSSYDDRGNDWGKTTPSTFNDIYANRSFHNVTPNLWNTTDKNTDAKDLASIMDATLLNQSNGWYTFADTTAGIANVLNYNKYPGGITAGTTMHIDIYCFDNDTCGGMDELKLKMVKTPETHVPVEVRYYLNTVTTPGSSNHLGTSYILDQALDTKIKLPSGTDSNQLNYLKAKAIEKAGGVNVSDGEQQGDIPYIVVEGDNVIDVVYRQESGYFGATTYTYDFGVNNQYSNAFDDVKELGSITDIDIPAEVGGRVTADKDTNTITYTPGTVNTGETVALTVTLKDGTKLTKYITFLPESNVMYEENMLTLDGTSWNTEYDDTYDDPNTPTNYADKLVTEHKDAYGFTEEYADDTKFSGGSALKATLTPKQFTDDATFTFTGTGFDLISECGTNTGMLLVGVKNKTTGKTVKAYLVDTYFCGDEADEDGNEPYVTGEGILDYQVPVVRNLALDYGTYTVTVTGYLPTSAGAVVNNSAVATQSASNAVPSVDEIFRAAGMSEYLDTGVEVVFMDDNSVLNGGTGPVVTVATPSFFSRVRSFFRGLVSTQAATAESSDDYCAYIDAFRVYQPLKDDPEVYQDNEKKTKYYSLYDFVKTSVNDLKDDYAPDAAVYIEYDGSTDIAAIADYKNQGPENEVYLAPGSAIVFGLQDYTVGDAVQVSAKQIGDVTATGIELETTSTEMYYDVAVEEDPDLGIHYVVISNDIDSEGILALSALKVSSTITAVASAELGNHVIEINKDADADFVPAMLTVSTPESTKIKRSYTIKVQSSSDVDHITIQPEGKEAITLTPTNKKAVDTGKAQYYSFSKAFKQTDADTYTYTVKAYDKDGKASAPVTVDVIVKAK